MWFNQWPTSWTSNLVTHLIDRVNVWSRFNNYAFMRNIKINFLKLIAFFFFPYKISKSIS